MNVYVPDFYRIDVANRVGVMLCRQSQQDCEKRHDRLRRSIGFRCSDLFRNDLVDGLKLPLH